MFIFTKIMSNVIPCNVNEICGLIMSYYPCNHHVTLKET